MIYLLKITDDCDYDEILYASKSKDILEEKIFEFKEIWENNQREKDRIVALIGEWLEKNKKAIKTFPFYIEDEIVEIIKDYWIYFTKNKKYPRNNSVMENFIDKSKLIEDIPIFETIYNDDAINPHYLEIDEVEEL